MKRLGAWGRRGSDTSGAAAKREEEVMQEGLADITMEELREFLEADELDVRADPEFKERLRKKLWAMLREQRDVRSDDGDDPVGH